LPTAEKRAIVKACLFVLGQYKWDSVLSRVSTQCKPSYPCSSDCPVLGWCGHKTNWKCLLPDYHWSNATWESICHPAESFWEILSNIHFYRNLE